MAEAAGLTWLQERALEHAYEGTKRKLLIAYLLAVPLGCFGTHRFYLGRIRSGCTMFALWMGGFLVSCGVALFVHDPMRTFAGDLVAGLMMLASWVWEIADFFLIPFIVRRVNGRIETALRTRLSAGQPV